MTDTANATNALPPVDQPTEAKAPPPDRALHDPIIAEVVDADVGTVADQQIDLAEVIAPELDQPEIAQAKTRFAEPIPRVAKPEAAKRQEPVPKPAAPRRSGSTLLGLLLGAAIAAGAGYGVQRYFFPQTAFDPSALEARLSAAEAEAQALRAEVARLSETAATSPATDQALLDRIAALEAVEMPEIAPLAARIDGVEANLAALANLPSETGVAPAVIATLQAEIAALKSRDAGVSTDLESLVADVEMKLNEAGAKAEELTAQATAIATAATRNASLSQIGAALESGLPYRAALTAIGDDAMPDILTSYADTGLPSVATLRAMFPEAARAALDEALRANPGENLTDRVATYLLTQTRTRSLEPREGADPDAVLSRAEGALARADVAAAMSELSALPPEALAAMADWTSLAQQRLDAQAALAALLQSAEQ